MINNKSTIVITGASSGIGYATALEFAKQGHKVYAIARNTESLEKLKCEAPNKNIVPISFDLSVFNKEVLDEVFSEIGKIDILVNNAGVLLNKGFLEITEDEISKVYNVNFVSVVKMIQYFHSRLKKSKQGHIVNIGSVGGVTGSVKFPGLSIYSSSKGALSILSECLAKDFKEDGISVNCLALGSVNTEMLNQAFPEFNSPTSAKQIANYIYGFALQASEVVNGTTQTISISNP